MRRPSPPSPIHVVAVGSPTERDHNANSRCWCHPAAEFRDLSTTATVWVHRPWAAVDGEVASMSTPTPNEALRGSASASVATGGLWDVPLHRLNRSEPE